MLQLFLNAFINLFIHRAVRGHNTTRIFLGYISETIWHMLNNSLKYAKFVCRFIDKLILLGLEVLL